MTATSRRFNQSLEAAQKLRAKVLGAYVVSCLCMHASGSLSLQDDGAEERWKISDVCSIADMNNDGAEEILVGREFWDRGRGCWQILSGIDGKVLEQEEGVELQQRLGHRVSRLPSGSGWIVSSFGGTSQARPSAKSRAKSESHSYSHVGSVQCWRGGGRRFEKRASEPGSGFGCAVVGTHLGGRDVVLIGQAVPFQKSGPVLMVDASTGEVVSEFQRPHGIEAGSAFGLSLACSDGFLAVGAPETKNPRVDGQYRRGAIIIFDINSGHIESVISSSRHGDFFTGYSLGFTDDWDQDGQPDLVAAALQWGVLGYASSQDWSAQWAVQPRKEKDWRGIGIKLDVNASGSKVVVSEFEGLEGDRYSGISVIRSDGVALHRIATPGKSTLSCWARAPSGDVLVVGYPTSGIVELRQGGDGEVVWQVELEGVGKGRK